MIVGRTPGRPAPVREWTWQTSARWRTWSSGCSGGTGPQGRGLAVRLAAAGQRVLLGSRDAERAAEVAAEVAARATAAAGGVPRCRCRAARTSTSPALPTW